jgi:NFU1 iron-sulfur cluster scaffold homolog, mitochondrial
MPDFNIHIEPTNSKNIVKFVANSFLTQASSYEFKNIDEAKSSPLAQQLFHLPFVKTVYISQNFIAIEKYDIVSWADVENEVADSIASYLNSGKSVIIEVETTRKTPVTIYAESTPNPLVMKFVANKPLVNGTFEFKTLEDSIHAPLAQELFQFSFVKEVFISANYVSIMKVEAVDWNDISMSIREFIRNYIENRKPILTDGALQNKNSSSSNESATQGNHNSVRSDIDKEIIAILDEYVKPAVASDGGHIAFDSFDEKTKTVRVILQGACSGCPSSTLTLKNGIESMLREMLNGRVASVEAING